MGEYVKGVNWTLGDCKASHAEYVAAAGVKKGEVNQHYNYLESPILISCDRILEDIRT